MLSCPVSSYLCRASAIQALLTETILDLPVSGIKVSATLIEQLPQDSQTLNFVARLNHQAQERGIELIAEHIENERL
jgi:EAL domain-containing protein (putative c-di-GMP-specific phosphodiesterase class I)